MPVAPPVGNWVVIGSQVKLSQLMLFLDEDTKTPSVEWKMVLLLTVDSSYGFVEGVEDWVSPSEISDIMMLAVVK
jgi:hypothetical protein